MERDLLTTRSLEVARTFATQDERGATDATDRTVGGSSLLPICGRTLECQILEQACAQVGKSFIKGGLDLV
jgi:hypothetical protein